MHRRSNPWPSFVDLFMVLLLVSFAALIAAWESQGECSGEFKTCTEKINDLEQTVKIQKEELDELRQRIWPSCQRRGITKHYLFSAFIMDVDRLLLDDKREFSPNEVPQLFDEELNKAIKNKCRHTALLKVPRGISATDLVDLENSLKKYIRLRKVKTGRSISEQ